MAKLTLREHDCLYLAADGKTSKEISDILGIALRTTNFHISRACLKLRTRKRQVAIVRAMIQGELAQKLLSKTN